MDKTNIFAQFWYPEDNATPLCRRLLEEVYRGGCVDSTCQSLAALMMALGPSDVSRCVTGPLSPYTVQFLRHIRDFLDVTFKLETHEQEEDEAAAEGEGDGQLRMGADKVKLTCVGIGMTNLSKRTT